MSEIELRATFMDGELCARAIEALKSSRLEPARVFAPVPSEEIAQALGHRRSPVRRFVLAGGIAGVLTGIAVTVGTSLEWNLVVGGKPIVSIPPFIIICFELMILFGGLSSALSFLFEAGMPAFDPIPGYAEEYSSDRFGLIVRCAETDGARAESILKSAGALEVVR
jgi:molybdopterin-containing oxidoreductase family membrane subunit